MNRARRDHEDQQPPMQVPVLRQITHTQFLVGEVLPSPDGGRVVNFVLPNGDALVFPLAAHAAKHLGEQLLAPSIEVAGPSDIPPRPNGNGRP
jgi:hypothetical protein